MADRIQLEIPKEELGDTETAYNADVRFDNPEAVNLGTVLPNAGFPEITSRVAEISQIDPITGRVIPGTGFRWIYNTLTGEKIAVHKNRIATVLKAKHSDPSYPDHVGKPVFSLAPTVPRQLGTTLCFLFPGIDQCPACGKAHPPHPDGWLRRMPGVKPCLAAHLANDYEALRHLQKRHSTAYALIQEAKEQDRRDEDRMLQRRTLETQEALVQALTKEK